MQYVVISSSVRSASGGKRQVAASNAARGGRPSCGDGHDRPRHFNVEDYAAISMDHYAEDDPGLMGKRGLAVYQHMKNSLLREASTRVQRWDYEYRSTPQGRASLEEGQH